MRYNQHTQPPTHSPPNIGSHKDNASAHDDEEGLQCGVVLEGLHGHALHAARVVVPHPATLPHQIRVVSDIEKLAQEHGGTGDA